MIQAPTSINCEGQKDVKLGAQVSLEDGLKETIIISKSTGPASTLDLVEFVQIQTKYETNSIAEMVPKANGRLKIATNAPLEVLSSQRLPRLSTDMAAMWPRHKTTKLHRSLRLLLKNSHKTRPVIPHSGCLLSCLAPV